MEHRTTQPARRWIAIQAVMLVALQLLMLPCLPQPAIAATLTSLYTFMGTGDGRFPQAGLLAGPDGSFYGTTGAGGASDKGEVFKVTPPAMGGVWEHKALHSFSTGDGENPSASLIMDQNGVLYGTTYIGGNGPCTQRGAGCGVVFKLTPPPPGKNRWKLTVLHHFQGPDGAHPTARLFMDASGALYGTTSEGGANGPGDCPRGCGVVFKLTPPQPGLRKWKNHVLHSFSGPDGQDPRSGVIMDGAGALYGTTSFRTTPDAEGGWFGSGGTVFQLTPVPGTNKWKHRALHLFGSVENDGSGPQGDLLMDPSGAIYGTTPSGGPFANGGGTIFRLTRVPGTNRWKKVTLFIFNVSPAGPDGRSPVAGLVMDQAAALYGVTLNGGGEVGFGWGTVFKLTPPPSDKRKWTHTVLHTFTWEDGRFPRGTLIMDGDGALYGTTSEGGGGSPPTGQGTVFKLVP